MSTKGNIILPLGEDVAERQIGVLYGWTEGGYPLHITQEAYSSILSQAEHDSPIESCGYALGTIGDDGGIIITENYPLTNTDHSEEHFSLDPREQFAAVKYARSKGLSVIAGWHSHPASPSRPSEEDKRLALDPRAYYLILSLAPDVSGFPYVPEGKPVLNAFKIADGVVTRFPVLPV